MKAYNNILSALKIGKHPLNNGQRPGRADKSSDLTHMAMLLKAMQKQIADQQQQIDALKTKPDETADLARVTTLLELMQTQVADQQKQIDALDTKASIILGATTVLGAAAAALFPGLISNHAEILTDSHKHWLLPAMVIVFAALACFSCLSYTVRRYKSVPEPQVLYDDYREDSEFYIKAQVFTAMVKASKSNETRIKKKVLWVTCAIACVGIEAFFLATILLLQVI